MSQDINVLALVKGAERYVFLYDDASRADVADLGRYASNSGAELHLVRRRRVGERIRQDSHQVVAHSRFDCRCPLIAMSKN